MTSTSIAFDYPRQNATGATCTAQAWAKTPPQLHGVEKATVIARIKQLLIQKNTALVAHYYVDGDIQDLALGTGVLLLTR
jgi:quinolinate synthase